MKLGRILKASFSLHEIAVMGIILTYALGGLALTAIFVGRVGFGIVLLLAALTIEMWFYAVSCCDGCGKPPRVRHYLDLGWCKLPIWRLWPERDCSSCGARLTGSEQN